MRTSDQLRGAVTCVAIVLGVTACTGDESRSLAEAIVDAAGGGAGDSVDDVGLPEPDTTFADTTGDAGGELIADRDVVRADSGTDAPVYFGDVDALLGENCVPCHQDGGIGPFSLDGYEQASAAAVAALAAVESGRMPPWLPNPDCRSYQAERSVSGDEVALLRAWVEAGTPRGDERDASPAPDPPPRVEADETWTMAEPYTPNPELPDDYHCFRFEERFEEETWLRWMGVEPGNRNIVHHVLVYAVPPASRGTLDAIDGRTEEPGYTCFGGPGVAGAQLVGAWVPGSVAVEPPEGAAFVIEAGSELVMQIHYNTANDPDGSDRTSVRLDLLDERPTQRMRLTGFAETQLEIPAGEPDAEHRKIIENVLPVPLTVIGIAPHMHTLGTRTSMRILRDDGPDECLVDIPEWDFNWQQVYLFEEGEAAVVLPGESVELVCSYDNTAANQPVVNGERVEPRDVSWGEGTLDEMCLTYLLFVEPFAGDGSGAVCGGYDSCVATCGFGLSACAIYCSAIEGPACRGCFNEAAQACLSGPCGLPLLGVVECLGRCDGSDDPLRCVLDGCSDELETLDACAAPVFESGACDEGLSECGIEAY